MASRKKAKSTPQTESSQKQDDAKRVSDIVKQYRSFFDVTENWRRAMLDDLNFEVGGRKQWQQSDLDELDVEKRPALSFNKIHAVTNFICGLQQDREQDFRYFPRGSEDEALGRILSAQVKYVMERAGGKHEQNTQFRLGGITGLSVVEVAHGYHFTDDLMEGDITLTALASNSWYCDPLARRYDKCDARYQGKLMWYDADSAAKQWPASQARLMGLYDWLPYDPLTTGVPEHLLRELYDKETNRVRILQHWYRVPVQATLLINKAEPDPQSAVLRMKNEQEAEQYIQQKADEAGLQAAQQYQIVPTTTLYGLMNKQTGGIMPLASPDEGQQFIDQVKKDAGRQIASQFEIVSREATALRVSHVTGWELLDDKPSPYEDDWRYPFSPFFCFHDGDNFDDVKGWVRDLKDPQREINWHHSTAVDTLARAPKGATWFDAAGNPNINELKKKLPRAGFIGTYTGAMPQFWPPASFSPGDLAMMEVAGDFLNSISGVTGEMVGATTQKTVSGRAIGARQAGGITGLNPIFSHWQRTKELTGLLLAKRVQQFHSPEKMDRIMGLDVRMQQLAGMPLQTLVPPQVLFEQYRQIQDLDFDVVVGFQDASNTSREAHLNRLLQFMSIGVPVPPGLLLEASDVPFKEEIKAALQKQGMQQPNPDMMKALTGLQGQSANGVNTSQ